jgi:hypothetical protein
MIFPEVKHETRSFQCGAYSRRGETPPTVVSAYQRFHLWRWRKHNTQVPDCTRQNPKGHNMDGSSSNWNFWICTKLYEKFLQFENGNALHFLPDHDLVLLTHCLKLKLWLGSGLNFAGLWAAPEQELTSYLGLSALHTPERIAICSITKQIVYRFRFCMKPVISTTNIFLLMQFAEISTSQQSIPWPKVLIGPLSRIPPPPPPKTFFVILRKTPKTQLQGPKSHLHRYTVFQQFTGTGAFLILNCMYQILSALLGN